MNYITASLSQTGGRSNNEDYIAHTEADGRFCWVFADGAGGHKGGEVASRLAAERTLTSFSEKPDISLDVLAGPIDAAQEAVVTHQTQEPDLAGMRTTLVVVICDEKTGFWGHAGDSRLYHLRQGRIVEITEDHSVVQKLVNAGELTAEATRTHPGRSRLYRAIGREELESTLRTSPCILQPGGAFLLCSDGLWEYLYDSTMVLTTGEDQTLKLWDIENGRVIGTYKPESVVTFLAFSPDGGTAVSGSRGGKAQLWSTATFFPLSGTDIRYLIDRFPKDLSVVGLIFSFTSNATKPIRTFEIQSSTVVAFAPDGQSMASGGTDGVVVVWNVNTGEATDLFTDHEYDLTALAFGPEGDMLASGGASGCVKIWQLDTGEESYTIEPDDVLGYQAIISLVYIDHGLVANDGKTVRVLSTSPEEEEINAFPVVMPERPF